MKFIADTLCAQPDLGGLVAEYHLLLAVNCRSHEAILVFCAAVQGGGGIQCGKNPVWKNLVRYFFSGHHVSALNALFHSTDRFQR